MSTETGWVHHYVSTACEHAVGENRPELHAACRLSCKFAEDGAESCRCPCHLGAPVDAFPPPWVDQAQGIARELLAAVEATREGLEGVNPDLYRRCREDPHLFWLRGEVQPPGEWRAPDGSEDGT